jgi:uncharacterized protein YdhG (YjbR/CyaY superfamily)
MAAPDFDSYLADPDEPKRSTLEQLRRGIAAALPDAEECISYAMPAFKIQGKTVAGFAAFNDHLSYLPTAVRYSPHLKLTSLATSTPRAHCTSRSINRYHQLS